MKKIILSSMFIFGMGLAFGQNVESIAKKAAKDAGCIEENGSYNFNVTNLGACASGIATTSAWTQVEILPRVSANLAPYVKLAPIARVTLCGNEVLTVECL